MKIDARSSRGPELYSTLVAVITPRPIAWVTTIDDSGRVNLAPYSFYNIFGVNPPVVVFSPTIKRDGSKKDTQRNIEANGEFVLNAAVESLASVLNESAAEWGPEDSEVERLGLETAPSTIVRPPRLVASPVAIECRCLQILPLGEGPGSSNLVIGEILCLDIDDAILGPDGRVDPVLLGAIGRLGGDDYCRTIDVFRLGRPQLPRV